MMSQPLPRRCLQHRSSAFTPSPCSGRGGSPKVQHEGPQTDARAAEDAPYGAKGTTVTRMVSNGVESGMISGDLR